MPTAVLHDGEAGGELQGDRQNREHQDFAEHADAGHESEAAAFVRDGDVDDEVANAAGAVARNQFR